ncbi:MAG: phosphoenolpyruvate--protein phosphotransferase [Desulfobacteraceae bacterium IS3]|nr:MAG: phosphoenolpyruvate--protein phosphotransferase [Desulfobacteraceae bacterium IS3]
MKKDHYRFNLLCDIGDLAALMTESADIENFLQSTVVMVSRYLNADVCSIYLYDEKEKELVLKATVGLDSGAIGRVRMKPGEGLIGLTFEKLRPIREASGESNPAFKYFRETKEELFESFLSVPITRGSHKIGVLAVQHKKYDFFNEIDIVVLRSLASQLAGTIENARFLINLNQTEISKVQKSPLSELYEKLRFVKGESASGGYAFALSSTYKRAYNDLLKSDSDTDDTSYSLEDFQKAVQKTSEQLIEFQRRLAEQLLESASLIFDAHFMILKDAKFMNKIAGMITDGISPPRAIKDVTGHYISKFSSSSNEYIREKVTDMEDLACRILRNLYNWSAEEKNFCDDRIVIAKELYPSEVLKLASEDVKGIILVSGGVTSHVSILCRSLKIPMIIADRAEILELPEGTPMLMDADIGNIYARPSHKVLRQFEERKKAEKKAMPLKSLMSPTTETADGVRVHLLANINLLSELTMARELKAEGIGLYRTEFPFLIRPTFPSEEEQYLIYKRLFSEMPDKEITVRTLDVGGDKILPYSEPTPPGTNPALGLRSIRFSLRHRDVFIQQIRAILRAAADAGEVQIMFPMISSLDEFREAREIVSDCMALLNQEKTPFHPHPAVGIMVEVPSVLPIIRELAQEADFFSIGTNDFVQYMLAVDRTNEKVSQYYRPYHPAVLRGLAQIVKAAVSENKPVSLCGEMAHDAEYIPFLLGIGVRSFSVDPQFLPVLQKRISRQNLSDAEKHADALLAEPTLKGTYQILQQYRILSACSETSN